MYLNEPLFTDFLNNHEILWLGIDFTRAKFTRKGFEITQERLRDYFNEWNMLIISDQKKYDIRVSFRKPVMTFNLSLVTKGNKSVRLNTAIKEHITLKDMFSEEEICHYLSTIETPQTQRYALLFIVESFDSHSKSAAIWVAVQHTLTHEPVLCEKFLKAPSGFGTKNYWGRVFYNLLYDIRSSSFYRWENLVKESITK
ncbi:MAG: hypothetical protein J5642_06980 [Bacteroidales bacterium]|nr:hypothetical protein [Bacteroidales bacterium]